MRFRSLVAVVFLAVPLAAQSPAPVGLLSSVKGTVQILRSGEKTPATARLADLIGPGDRVLTTAGSEAGFLFCPGSVSARLAGAGEVSFTATALQVRRGKLSDERKVAGCRLPATLALSGASQQQVGLVRTRSSGGVVLRTPSRTFISDMRPRFHWLPVDGAKSYEVSVTDREERVLYKTTINGTQAEYPPDAPALTLGQKYWWRVSAKDSNDVLAEAGTFFQTLPQTQYAEFQAAETDLRKQIAASPNDNGPRFLLAFLYEENGLLEDAARAYNDLTQRLGPNDWLNFRMISVLNRLGWDKVEP